MTLKLRPIGVEWELALTDDGVGLDGSRPPVALGAKTCDGGRGEGHGLSGMRMRAAEIGARLRVESEPARGTLVAVRFATGAAGSTLLNRRRSARATGGADLR